MRKTRKLIYRMINEVELGPSYASARIEPPYNDDPELAVAQAAADATIETAGKILNSLNAEEEETISELEKFIEDEIAKVEEGELYGYEADVFSNPPLALIQGQAKAKISAYKNVLEKIKNLKEGEENADK